MPKTYGTAGPRQMYPSVATSKALARCSLLAQLLFDRLIVQADDQGRLEDGAEFVRAVCVPLVARVTTKSVEAALSELAAAGLILRYRASKRELLQVNGWWEHQGGMRWAYPSRFPAPPDWIDRVKKRKGDDDGTGPDDDGHIPTKADNGRNLSDLARAGGTEPNHPEPEPALDQPNHPDERDILDDYYRLTARFPTANSKDWLLRIQNEFGLERTSQTLGRVFMEDPSPKTLLSRLENELRSAQHADERKAQEREVKRLEEWNRDRRLSPEQIAENERRRDEILATWTQKGGVA
jgi:hypothetical protein